MSRKLDDLTSRFRPLAVEFLARLTEARIPIVIIDTLRTPAEQAANIARGVSWTTRSKHLIGEAIDVAPFEEWRVNGANKLLWDAKHPQWQRIGEIGESCGLVWGGRWKSTPDLGHFEHP